MGWFLATACLVVLVGQVLWGRRLDPVLRFLLVVQAGYWCISYVIRPVVLMAVGPTPSLGDTVADPRLWAPDYNETIPKVQVIVLVGLLLYLASSMVAFRLAGPGYIPAINTRPQVSREPFLLLWAAGWILRLVSLMAPGIGLLGTLSLIGSIGSGGVIVFCRTPRWPTGGPWMIWLVIAGELAWSMITLSKTPIISAGLALVLRFVITGWTPKATRLTLAGVFLLVLSFSTLQQYKFSDQSVAAYGGPTTSQYPQWLQSPLYVIQRFDLFSAVTDASRATPGSWIEPNEVPTRIVDSLLPTLVVGEKTGAGTAWNLEVRSQSVPYAEASDVSLAEGFIAEGYALGGWLGIAIEAVLLSLLVLLVARGLGSSSTVYLYWSLLMLSFPVLFERGAFGLMETSSKTLQAALVAAVVAAMHRALTSQYSSAGGSGGGKHAREGVLLNEPQIQGSGRQISRHP